MMMHPYRCAICGETSLASTAPERCPFCGSDIKNLIPAAEWINYGKVDMSEQSYKYCKKALMLELRNYNYYKCSVEKAENKMTQGIFERLMEQEFEHAEVFAEAMGIELSEEFKCNYDVCEPTDEGNMMASNRHESMALDFYTMVADKAPEPRIKQIFSAIAEVESQHLVLTNLYLTRD